MSNANKAASIASTISTNLTKTTLFYFIYPIFLQHSTQEAI